MICMVLSKNFKRWMSSDLLQYFNSQNKYQISLIYVAFNLFFIMPAFLAFILMPYVYYYMKIYHSLLLIFIFIFANALASRQKVIEDQLNELLNKVRNKNIAMLTNPTSVDGHMTPLFDRIIAQKDRYNVTVRCFFAPEHGLRGDQQAGSGDQDYIDQTTGIQVYSLYGVRKAPTNDQLKGVEALIYDIQDVGARYYTYIWTLTYTIESCAQNKVQVIIFDRPNPLGRKIQGCPSKIDAGLIGRLLPGQAFTVPQRYGLTIGELITFLKVWLPFFQLTIIKMSELYKFQDYQWVLSSPNIPTMDIVYIYSGFGLFEGTSVSQGRGTTKPFQLVGNPDVNARDIINYFEKNKQITGYGRRFYLRQTYFIPTFSKYLNKICGGVQLHLIDRQNFDSVATALHMMKAFNAAIKDGSMKFSSGLDRMFGIQGFFTNIQTKSVEQILNNCQQQRLLYAQMSKKVWLYNAKSTKQILE